MEISPVAKGGDFIYFYLHVFTKSGIIYNLWHNTGGIEGIRRYRMKVYTKV